jgi:hypothetical protein
MIASTMVTFNPNHKSVLDDILLGDPRIRPGKMFGYPAYFVGRKLCFCLYEGGVGIKVPAPIASQLMETDMNAVPFQPLGRPRMKEWVQINLEQSEDYRKYRHIFDQSIDYIQSKQEE